MDTTTLAYISKSAGDLGLNVFGSTATLPPKASCANSKSDSSTSLHDGGTV